MTGSERRTVLVTGATGRVGRLVVDELLRTGVPVRALTRRPEHAALPAGVEVVAGDLTDPASLDPALEGAVAVFLVWTAAPATAPAVVARLAEHPSPQPRRIVYLSAPHRTPHPFFQQPNPMRDLHAEVERLLAATGLEVAVLRPGMFASNVLHWWAPQIRIGDVVRWPYAAAETAPIDERDIAAVAARVLLDARHARGDFVLTGPESLSQAAQVHTIGDAIGRPLRLEELSPDEFRRDTAGTWPGGVVEMLLAAWKATLGHPAFVTSAVHEILGSPPRSFHQWAADHAAAFGVGNDR
ncbi:MAG TPA: NAD(P)H-binding protein [Thermoanaerobaculia bacterium]|nr:NAD(P)H-binding protein [Thermoanaerobaculia bacterium]